MLLSLVPATAGLATEMDEEHEVVGRFSITSEAGGAVWAFQPSGLLVITGPGDIISEGSWAPASGEREFDAAVDYEIAGQMLTVHGQVAPDEVGIAVYVQATEPQRPGDAEPWPAESRLVGERMAMMPEVTASPSPSPADCMRPVWVDGEVDWDRCDTILTTAA